MKNVSTEWIKKLIRENRLEEFYSCSTWKKIREQKKRLEHYECERCRAKGRYAKGEVVHHKKYLRNAPELALTISNLEVLCEKCHYEEHHKRAEPLTPERW